VIKILFASNNKGKYDELVDSFNNIGIDLIFDGNLELLEEAPTLELNAISKAKLAARQRKMISLSDDTGFFIPALDYFPGVNANRWMAGTWAEKREAILRMMKNKKEDRRAYLLNKFVLVDENGEILLITEVKNWYEIAYEEHTREGHETFGYNPILIMQGHYIGDMTRDERNFIKNRGRIAFEVLDTIIKKNGR